MAHIYRRVNGMKIERLIAKHETVQARLSAIALERGLEAEALLDGRSQRRTFTSTISVEVGDVDRYVTLDDTRGLHAAAAIEFGHKTKSGAHVEGLHVLRDTFGLGK